MTEPPNFSLNGHKRSFSTFQKWDPFLKNSSVSKSVFQQTCFVCFFLANSFIICIAGLQYATSQDISRAFMEGKSPFCPSWPLTTSVCLVIWIIWRQLKTSGQDAIRIRGYFLLSGYPLTLYSLRIPFSLSLFFSVQLLCLPFFGVRRRITVADNCIHSCALPH